MGTVEDLIVKLKNLPTFVDLVGDNSIAENEDTIIDLNKAQMIVLGIDADGDQLGEYTPYSSQIREAAGLQTEFIDLRFTGDFQDSIELNLTPNGYEIDATDEKWTDKIEPRFPDALGLIDDNEDRVTNIITSKIEKESEKYFQTSTTNISVLV